MFNLYELITLQGALISRIQEEKNLFNEDKSIETSEYITYLNHLNNKLESLIELYRKYDIN